MKMTITFEFEDVLETIVKMLATNGTRPRLDDAGRPRIDFNVKKKEVTVHCEAAPLPDACLFCGRGVDQSAPIQQDDESNESNESNKHSSQENDESQEITDQEENAPMSLAQLKAQSRALSHKKGPIKHDVQRGAEAHAALARPSLMDGESGDPPFGEGGV
jgi:hypothetical protein